MKLILAILTIALLSQGCSTFHQRYYAACDDGDNVNYYRISLDGYTFFTRSDFQSGTASAEIVDKLMGEGDSLLDNGENNNNRNDNTSSTSNGNNKSPVESKPVAIINPATGKVLKDQKLVFVLSSNPNQIFSQLQGLAAAEGQEAALLSILGASEKKDYLIKNRQFNRTMYENYVQVNEAKKLNKEILDKTKAALTADQKKEIITGFHKIVSILNPDVK